MTDNEAKVEVHRRLEDVVFERSETAFIDGRVGAPRYRGETCKLALARAAAKQ